MRPDENQLKAMEFNEGPALVIAGPGSGKTTVLTRRVAYLIEQMNVSPHRILVITFTRSAASQMKDRFNSVSKDYNPVTFCTFHSLFLAIIKSSDNNRFTVISPEEKVNICRQCMVDNNIDIDSVNVENLLDEFSKLNNSMDNILDFHSSVVPNDKFKKVYFQYANEKNKQGKIDYDDFSVVVNKLLLDNNILSKWQKMYDYVLIDEFQDVNSSQYEIIKRIFINKNIYAVGDEDQSIYGFRGSSPDICFRFEREFDAQKFYLINNYRSSKEIVFSASKLIKHNKKRYMKDFKAINTTKGEVLNVFEDNFDSLYMKMVKDIKMNMNKEESSILLTRTNSLPEGLLKMFSRYGIQTGDNNTKEVNKDIFKVVISYFRLSQKTKRIDDLLVICNKPNRYISRTFINLLNNENEGCFKFSDAFRLAKGKSYLIKELYILERNLIELSKMDSYEGIIYIFKVIGYEKYLKEKGICYKEELKKLKEFAKDFMDINDFIDNNVLLNVKSESATNNLEIRTMHSSKGLEWDNVYIVELQEGQLPHKRCSSLDEIEEERRLLYVAMTRAKKRLWMGYVNNKENGIFPSIFINELL